MWTRCESSRDSISCLSSRIFASFSCWFLSSALRSSAIQLCSDSSFLLTFNPQPLAHSAVSNLHVFECPSSSRLVNCSWHPSFEHETNTKPQSSFKWVLSASSRTSALQPRDSLSQRIFNASKSFFMYLKMGFKSLGHSGNRSSGQVL